ncbi:MAG: bifunctional DNA primase/polymerase [Acidobacteria bacterium]|nr:bifunctional DNA primase/polymerase [Acidobacteriota bacterium]
MNSFSEIAVPLADRGFRVFPLIPRTKRPLPMAGDYDHFDAASTDVEQLQHWNQQQPQANVGIIPDENFCFLETDDEVALRAACADLPSDVWDTTRASARENRCYFIYRQTMRTRRAGNMTLAREGKENLFEFKQHRLYVTGPGSIHPTTGKPYDVEWRRIPAMPDILLNRLCELYGKPKATGSLIMNDETKRQTALIDKFLEYYEVADTGNWFNKGKQWYKPIECPWGDEHDNANEGTSTCVVYTAGGGYGFDCKHRCSSKGWKDFRAELERRLPDHKFSFVADGASANVVVDARVEQPKRLRPEYPITAWEATVVAEFAKLCANDNNIPRKLYAEAFRCTLGAVVGDRIACDEVEGALPRTYTVIVAPKGKGKGTAIRRAVRFFDRMWNSARTSVTPGLLSGTRDFIWKPKGIGAWLAAASSVPGMARLTKDLQPTINSKPQMAWGDTLPRILSVHEEMKTFLSTLFIEGGVGSGMEGVVCQLWDDVTFHGTATGTREALYGEMMFSLLAGVTEEDWFDLLSRGNAVGSGLMSRFNMIGTQGQYDNVSRMSPPTFVKLQEAFLPRILQLEDAPCHVPPTEAAERIIGEWTEGLPEGSERMNIHVWRSAMLIAWLRHEDAITAKTAEDATLLGQYQIASHDYYRTQAADNATAKAQARIMRTLQMRGPMCKRDLQRNTNANRDGTELWNRALGGLVQDGAVAHGDDGAYFVIMSSPDPV